MAFVVNATIKNHGQWTFTLLQKSLFHESQRRPQAPQPKGPEGQDEKMGDWQR